MRIRGAIIFFTLLFFSVLVVRAATAEEITPASQDLFRFGDVVEMSAPISGDVYAMGLEVVVRGSVAGDVLAFGQVVTIKGPVAGNVRIVGDTVILSADIRGNVSILARSLRIEGGTHIEKNIVFAGQHFDFAGNARRDMRVWMFAPEEMIVRSGAVVEGMATVRATTQPIVEDGALLRHAIERTGSVNAGSSWSDILFNRISALFSLFLVGLVAIHMMHRPSLVIISMMNDKPLWKILLGFGCLVVAPLLVIALALTVIGIPLAAMLFAVWVALFYGARIFAGLALGFFLLERFDRKRHVRSLVIVLLFGVTLLIIGESLPFVGVAIAFLAACWGVGGVATLLRTITLEKPKPS